jgi:RNA polymerase sigma-B factor
MSVISFQEYVAVRDIRTRNLLVQANQNLARKEAHAIAQCCPEPYEDLEQEAMLGLIRSVENFDPNKGIAFSSYAVPYIHGKLLQYLRDKGHLIRLSQSTQTLINRSKKIMRDLSQELGRTPTSAEVAQRLNVPLPKYEAIKTANRAITSNVALDDEAKEDMVYFAATVSPTEVETPVVQIDWSNLSQGELATLRRKKGDRRKVWKFLAHESTKATTQS